MGRQIRVEFGGENVSATLGTIKNGTVEVKIGEKTVKCRLIHRQGHELAVRIGEKAITLYEIKRGVYVIGRTTVNISEGMAAHVSSSSGGDKTVKAIMPGLVVKVNVQQGQQVNAGDTLLVLEAMKMENEVKSKAAGTVKQVHVKAGDVVETQAILVELE